MDFIFLDTSVFVKYNYLDGSAIQSLLNLSKSKICRWVLTEVIYQEILKNFNESLLGVQQQINGRKFSILKNFDSGKAYLDNFNYEELKNNFKKEFDKAIVEANALVLDESHCDLKKVMQNYYSGTPPFNKKDKKNEFPDAISLTILENHFSNDFKCLVFSADTDLLEYNSNSLTIYSGEGLPNYVKEKDFELHSSQYERTEYLKYLINQKQKEIERLIDLAVKETEIERTSFELLVDRKTFNRQVEDFSIDSFKFELLLTSIDFFEINFKVVGKLQILYTYFQEKNYIDTLEIDSMIINGYELDVQGLIKIPVDDIRSHGDFQINNINYGDNNLTFYHLID